MAIQFTVDEVNNNSSKLVRLLLIKDDHGGAGVKNDIISSSDFAVLR